MTSNPLAQNFGFRSLLAFAFPTISMMLFMGLYTIIDTIFIARFVNTNALSAINIVCPLLNLMVGLATMVATGGSAVVARRMGSNDMEKAKQAFTLIISFGLMLGIVIMVVGITWLDSIVYALGADDILFPYCKEYIKVILLFAPASMLQVLFQSLFVTAGKPTLGLVLSVCAGVMNILFDYVFMVPCDMGISGAGLGTGLGYLIPAIGGILYFSRSRETLSFVKPVLDYRVLIESCVNGSSEMVSQLSTAVTTFFFNAIMMRLLGVSGVASITIIIYTQFVMTTLYIGFSMGIVPIFSYQDGAHNYPMLHKVYLISVTCILISSLFIYLLSIGSASCFIQLFTKENKEVFHITVQGFHLFAISFLFSGFNIYSSSLFTALSNGKLSALISFLRTFGLLLPFLLFLPEAMGLHGVWLAVPLAEAVTLCLSLFLNYRLWCSWSS